MDIFWLILIFSRLSSRWVSTRFGFKLIRIRGSFFSYYHSFPYQRAQRKVNYRQVEKKILDEILGKEVYDTRLRPPGTNNSISTSATLVHVNIFVRDFAAISDVGMQYDFSITLRQRWNDQRLSFEDKLQYGMKGE